MGIGSWYDIAFDLIKREIGSSKVKIFIHATTIAEPMCRTMYAQHLGIDLYLKEH
jgi:hypothetical protein